MQRRKGYACRRQVISLDSGSFFLAPIQFDSKLGVLFLDVFFACPGTAVVGLLDTSTADDRLGVAEYGIDSL
jgi:hypothetical protein